MPDPVVNDPVAEYQQEMLARAATFSEQVETEAKRKDDFFGIPQAVQNATTVTICSIWPEPLESQAFQHSYFDEKANTYRLAGNMKYKIAAGSPTKPAYLHLTNNFSMVIGKDNDDRVDQPKVNEAAKYGADIVKFWAGEHLGAHIGKRGIGIISGKVATPQEIAFLEQAQIGFLDFLIDQATAWDKSKHPNDHKKIGKIHHMALRLRGRDNNQYPWARKDRVAQNSDCPYCSRTILARAIVCEHCDRDIVQYFVERNLTPDSRQWPRVVEEMERMTAPKSQKEK